MALTRINNQALTNVTSAGLPSGTVLQVQSTTDNTEISYTCGTTPYNYSELNTSIIPSSTSSKILVQLNFGCLQFGETIVLWATEKLCLTLVQIQICLLNC